MEACEPSSSLLWDSSAFRPCRACLQICPRFCLKTCFGTARSCACFSKSKYLNSGEENPAWRGLSLSSVHSTPLHKHLNAQHGFPHCSFSIGLVAVPIIRMKLLRLTYDDMPCFVTLFALSSTLGLHAQCVASLRCAVKQPVPHVASIRFYKRVART